MVMLGVKALSINTLDPFPSDILFPYRTPSQRAHPDLTQHPKTDPKGTRNGPKMDQNQALWGCSGKRNSLPFLAGNCEHEPKHMSLEFNVYMLKSKQLFSSFDMSVASPPPPPPPHLFLPRRMLQSPRPRPSSLPRSTLVDANLRK